METIEESRSLFSAGKKLTFLFLCLATFMLLYVKVAFIEFETAAFEFLADEPEGGVLRVISGLKFVAVPLIYLWKFTVIGFVIWVGCFMFGYRVTFSQCWSIVIVAEFTFLVAELFKILWFFFFDTDPTYDDIRGFYPFSLMNFYDYQELEKRYAYPLRALNLFEIVYWFVLVQGVHHFARKQKSIAWFIVLSSYVLIFFLWLWFYIVVYK
jgi:hypothetical protein